MSEVQPIRDQRKIREIDTYLKGKSDRDHILWLVGVQSGLRVSDIVKLRVDDVWKQDIRRIKEKKTEKQRPLYLNSRSMTAIQRYIKEHDLQASDWLLPSRRSDGSGHISITQAYRIIREAGEACGCSHVGTHTMRKSFGYHYYKKTHDVATLMRIFNHASPSVTLRYIGIEREQIEDSLADFYLL